MDRLINLEIRIIIMHYFTCIVLATKMMQPFETKSFCSLVSFLSIFILNVIFRSEPIMAITNFDRTQGVHYVEKAKINFTGNWDLLMEFTPAIFDDYVHDTVIYTNVLNSCFGNDTTRFSIILDSLIKQKDLLTVTHLASSSDMCNRARAPRREEEMEPSLRQTFKRLFETNWGTLTMLQNVSKNILREQKIVHINATKSWGKKIERESAKLRDSYITAAERCEHRDRYTKQEITNTFNKFSYQIMIMTHTINEYIFSKTLLTTGYLNNFYLSNDEIDKIITEINTPKNPIFESETHQTHLRFAIHAYSSSRDIKIFAKFPLRHRAIVATLYEIILVPIPTNIKGLAFYYDTPNKFLITFEDSPNYIAVMDDYLHEKCTGTADHGKLTCEMPGSVESSETHNCIYDLFVGRMEYINFYCDINIIYPPYQIIRQISGSKYYIYSVQPSNHLIFICEDQQSRFFQSTETFIAKGVGIAQWSYGKECANFSRNETMYTITNPSPQINNQIFKQIPKVVHELPSTEYEWLKTFFKPNYYKYLTKAFRNNSPEGIPLRIYKANLEKAAVEVEERSARSADTVKRTKRIYNLRLGFNAIVYGIIGMILMITIIIAYCCCFAKCYNTNNRLSTRQNRNIEIIHPFNYNMSTSTELNNTSTCNLTENPMENLSFMGINEHYQTPGNNRMITEDDTYTEMRSPQQDPIQNTHIYSAIQNLDKMNIITKTFEMPELMPMYDLQVRPRLNTVIEEEACKSESSMDLDVLFRD